MRAASRGPARTYANCVSSEGQGTLTMATLRRQRLQRQELARRVLPIAMIAVIVAAVRTQPEPGAHGVHLGIALAVAGLAVTTAGLALARNHPRPQGVVFALLLASSAALLWLQPGGPGVIAAVATLLAALFARRIDAQDARADRMLVVLEQTRGAELRAAALAERQRLAREMHDVLAHSLSGLVMSWRGPACWPPPTPQIPG